LTWLDKAKRVVAYSVMIASACGLVGSIFLHIHSFVARDDVSRKTTETLFLGIFFVWVPTILLASSLTRDFKQRDLWKAALRGCPAWMYKGIWILWGYAFFVAFVLPFLRGSNPGASPGGFLVFPAVFYSVSFGVAYSTLHVGKFDEGRRCANGHPISPLAKFCEECGASAAPNPTIKH
jgi:hypothetical protein